MVYRTILRQLGLVFLLNPLFDFPIPKLMPHHPTSGKSTPEVIVQHGYPLETHTILTEDGYILTYYRIPYGKRSGPKKNRPVVLIQHGLHASSRCWFLQPEDKTFPFMFAEAGYDVWISNSRGTRYSKGHLFMSSRNNDYWQFSWDDIGYYDLPAAIDYILAYTKQKQLFYMGHSEGATLYYVMLSRRPEYNNKIRAGATWAPSVFMENVRGPDRFLSKFLATHFVLKNGMVLTEFGGGQANPEPLLSLYYETNKRVCRHELIAYGICQNIVFLISGFNRDQMNITHLPEALAQYPDTGSFKSYIHYGQSVIKGTFARFDYGPSRNLATYGTPTPPEYNLSRVTTPTAIFLADNDWLASPKDIDRLRRMLPNVQLYHKIEMDVFTHIDYVLGKNAAELVYHPTIEYLNRFR